LIALHGELTDAGDFGRLDALFTDDFLYDVDRTHDAAGREAGRQIRCLLSGAARGRSDPGTPATAARSNCGANSRQASPAMPSTAATSSPSTFARHGQGARRLVGVERRLRTVP
jgi:hypothetical protein